jgi:hypothetical protein
LKILERKLRDKLKNLFKFQFRDGSKGAAEVTAPQACRVSVIILRY